MTGTTPTENVVAELRSIRKMGGLSPAHLVSSEAPILSLLLNRPKAKDRYDVIVRLAYDLGATEPGICARRALHLPDESPKLRLSKSTSERRVQKGFGQLASLIIEHAVHEGVPYVAELESDVVGAAEDLIAHVAVDSDEWKRAQDMVQRLILDHLQALSLLQRVRSEGWLDEFDSDVNSLQNRGNEALSRVIALVSSRASSA